MTEHAVPQPRRRLADHGRAGRALAWFREWGLLVLGVWLVCVSAVLIWVAINFAQSQKQTESNARQACVRARDIGPEIVMDYERRHVLTPRVLAEYRALIPKSC